MVLERYSTNCVHRTYQWIRDNSRGEQQSRIWQKESAISGNRRGIPSVDRHEATRSRATPSRSATDTEMRQMTWFQVYINEYNVTVRYIDGYTTADKKIISRSGVAVFCTPRMVTQPSSLSGVRKQAEENIIYLVWNENGFKNLMAVVGRSKLQNVPANTLHLRFIWVDRRPVVYTTIRRQHTNCDLNKNKRGQPNM